MINHSHAQPMKLRLILQFAQSANLFINPTNDETDCTHSVDNVINARHSIHYIHAHRARWSTTHRTFQWIYVCAQSTKTTISSSCNTTWWQANLFVVMIRMFFDSFAYHFISRRPTHTKHGIPYEISTLLSFLFVLFLTLSLSCWTEFLFSSHRQFEFSASFLFSYSISLGNFIS